MNSPDTLSAAGISPVELERVRIQAQAEKLRRQRAGDWKGDTVDVHPYADRALEWIVKYLEVPEETLRWSLLPEYANHKWDGDADPLVLMLDAISQNRDCCTESATGTGKTYLLACVVFWYLATHEDSIVITAAPKADQLLLHVWKEIGRLFPRFKRHFPQAEMFSGKLRMKPTEEDKETWAATAFVAGVGADEEIAQRAAGFHARFMLWITEETPGMPPQIMNTIENTRTGMTNPHLAVGNPDHRNDPLHRFCFDERGDQLPDVTHVRISALDHPNVVTGREIVPGAVSLPSIERRTRRYGKGSRLYESRIRGISPAESSDALIKWDWCTAAAARYNDPAFRAGSLGMGVDVANSENGDKAAIARGQGACLTEVESFPCSDASQLGKTVALEVLQSRDRAEQEQKPSLILDPRYVGIDDVGVGASAVNKARELGVKLRYISGGRRAVPGLDVDTLWSETTEIDGKIKPIGPAVIEAERFADLRSQVWWRMREDLRLGHIAIPQDEELWLDLTTPTYSTPGGKITVEPKIKIFARLRRSPNKGDAACYWNWVRRRVPLRTSTNEKSDPRKRDTQYEKIVAAREKHEAAERRRMKRVLHQKSRGRRAG